MHGASSGQEQVRTAEIIAALSLATDLGIGLPLEHGLHSTVCAMRLCDLLGVDDATATQTYYGCLLFYIGCTTDAEIAAELFDEGALVTHFNPAIFGSPFETVAGIARALAGTGTVTVRTVRVARRLPRAVRGHRRHIAAMCEVARMLTERLGLPPDVRELFGHLTERWDGKGEPAGLAGDEIPLPLRIIHVARDAALQHLLGGEAHAARVVGERAGHAFDPAIASLLVGQAGDILAGARTPRPGRRHWPANRGPTWSCAGSGSGTRSRPWATSPTFSPPVWSAIRQAWPRWPRPRPTGVGGRTTRSGRSAEQLSCTTWGAWPCLRGSGRSPDP